MPTSALFSLSAVILLVGWLAGLQPATAQSGPERNPPLQQCLPTVEQEIEHIEFPRSRIDRIQMVRRQQDISGKRRTIGFDGWVRLNDCPGSLIVDMDRSCRVRQVYVRGKCEVLGVKTYR